MVSDPALALHHVSLTVPDRVLIRDSDLRIEAGELVALLGPSGSGKTSLINVAAGISAVASGQVVVAGRDISRAGRALRAQHRLRRIGLVFQFSELLPELTVRENVALPLLLASVARPTAVIGANESLARVGLEGYDDRWPESLSGGEAQRVAIARAIVTAPALVLADEPTGALDEGNSQVIGQLFRDIARITNCGVLVGTHDPVVARLADRIVRIDQTRLVGARG